MGGIDLNYFENDGWGFSCEKQTGEGIGFLKPLAESFGNIEKVWLVNISGASELGPQL